MCEINLNHFADLVSRYPQAAEAGRRQAEADIAVGSLRLIHCFESHECRLSEWAPHYRRLLRDRLGVDGWVHFPRPFTDWDATQAFAVEHYRVMAAAIEQHFGVGILCDLAHGAKQAHALEVLARSQGARM